MTTITKSGTMSWRSKGRFARKNSGTVTLSRHKERIVTKLYDPFSGREVEFGKADNGGDIGLPTRVMGYSTPDVSRATQVSALLPTGSHVGHGQDLKHLGHRKSQGKYGSTKLLKVTKSAGVEKGLMSVLRPKRARNLAHAKEVKGRASALDRSGFKGKTSYFA